MNKRLFTFFVCLLVSVLFWLLMALSKEYAINLRFPVTYVNAPNNKIVSGYLPSHIDIIVKAKGFSLLTYHYLKKTNTLTIDLKDSKSNTQKNNFYLITNTLIDKIASQFNSTIAVLNVKPDTIYFKLDKKKSKEVPIKLNQKITFKDEFQLVDSIKINPKTIKISGAPEVIEKIKYIETNPLVLNDVDKSAELKLSIKKIATTHFLQYDQSETTVFINVQKFTETSMDLPIKIENLPSTYNLKLFPDKITLKYQVSFDNYAKVKPSDFKIIADYKSIEKESNKIKVKVIKFPKFIKSLKLLPEKVEYILRK